MGSRVTLKRVFMGLCALGYIPLAFWEEMRSVYYVTPLCTLSVFALLINFPWISRSMYSKPMWPDDLRDDLVLDPVQRTRFENMFYLYSNVGYSLLFGVILDWRLYRIDKDEESLNWLVILGLIGGLFQLASTARSYIAIAIMAYVRRLKDRETGAPETVLLPRRFPEMSKTELMQLVHDETS